MGETLIQILCEATGLPNAAIESEIDQLLASHDKTRDQLTLEDLRVILAEYLQDVLVSAKEKHQERNSESC